MVVCTGMWYFASGDAVRSLCLLLLKFSPASEEQKARWSIAGEHYSSSVLCGIGVWLVYFVPRTMILVHLCVLALQLSALCIVKYLRMEHSGADLERSGSDLEELSFLTDDKQVLFLIALLFSSNAASLDYLLVTFCTHASAQRLTLSHISWKKHTAYLRRTSITPASGHHWKHALEAGLEYPLPVWLLFRGVGQLLPAYIKVALYALAVGAALVASTLSSSGTMFRRNLAGFTMALFLSSLSSFWVLVLQFAAVLLLLWMLRAVLIRRNSAHRLKVFHAISRENARFTVTSVVTLLNANEMRAFDEGIRSGSRRRGDHLGMCYRFVIGGDSKEHPLMTMAVLVGFVGWLVFSEVLCRVFSLWFVVLLVCVAGSMMVASRCRHVAESSLLLHQTLQRALHFVNAGVPPWFRDPSSARLWLALSIGMLAGTLSEIFLFGHVLYAFPCTFARMIIYPSVWLACAKLLFSALLLAGQWAAYSVASPSPECKRRYLRAKHREMLTGIETRLVVRRENIMEDSMRVLVP
eukprot:TRINITY_DN6504_c0_g1_i2.p1 TRINITY_DN6504_c0_g1~~TRINITY_DN6504_c0_g1_i2.p1  ORF type:complete len:524 (-),score=86.16 TRINITY_DN6504_c0_g1_i2:1088-2659(-)